MGKHKSEKTALSQPLFSVLVEFTKLKQASTYEIFKILKTTPRKVAYKNIHTKIQNLLSLKLIKRINKLDRQHGAIFYQLTEFGIEYLLSQKTSNWAEYYGTEFIKNHGDYFFFKQFAYPYLDRTTLEQLRSPDIVLDFFQYFADCKRILDFAREELDVLDRTGVITFHVLFWDEIREPIAGDIELEKFLMHLKQMFKLSWITNRPKIRNIDDSTTEISEVGKFLTLKIDETKTKVSLQFKNKVLFEYQVESNFNRLELSRSEPIAQKDRILHVDNNLTSGVAKYLEKLMYSLIRYSNVKYMIDSVESTRKHDLNLLANDRKFLMILLGAKDQFNRSYNKFMKYRNKS
jgi:hypothetical protein